MIRKYINGTVMLVFSALLTLFVSACAEVGDGSSSQGKQVETVAPAGTRTVEQMEAFEKSHPPSDEKRIMPIPGMVPEQEVDVQYQRGKTQLK